MSNLNLKLLDNVPTPKQEDWKYTNLKPLLAHEFMPKIQGGLASSIALEKSNKGLGNNNFFAALNVNYQGEKSHILIDEKQAQQTPVIVLNHQADDQDFLPSTLDIELAENVQVTLVEKFSGTGTYLRSAVQNLHLGRGAKLNHYRLQTESDTGFHMAVQSVHLSDRAVYRAVTLTLGAALSRHECDVNIAGQEAQCHLSGVMLQRHKQHADTTLRLHHSVANAQSTQNYKTILDDSATAVFQGRVVVDAVAQRTDANQMNKALLLSDTATMNAKPELKIYADDVKCSHGATIGAIDEQALFYLRSRGLSEKQATALLIEAFIAEILNDIDDETLRSDWLKEATAWLNK